MSKIFNISKNGNCIFFSGAINEDSDFSVLDNLEETNIIFDLDKVVSINSCGIREWIKFQNNLPANLQITYTNCPQVVVEQMNIIKGFIKDGGVIESFYAPYYNETKDEEKIVLIKPDQVVDNKAPEIKDEDGNLLEFDDIPSQYFNFLKNL